MAARRREICLPAKAKACDVCANALFAYRHCDGSVCTTSSDGRFMGMISFTEFPTIAARHRASFPSQYMPLGSQPTCLAYKDLTRLDKILDGSACSAACRAPRRKAPRGAGGA